jgi:hypothetical protein
MSQNLYTSNRRFQFERMDPEMVEVLRAKTPAERLEIAQGMFRAAQRMIGSHLRAEHPEWDEAQVEQEVARRISLGSG